MAPGSTAPFRGWHGSGAAAAVGARSPTRPPFGLPCHPAWMWHGSGAQTGGVLGLDDSFPPFGHVEGGVAGIDDQLAVGDDPGVVVIGVVG